jgi:hypothetical protein
MGSFKLYNEGSLEKSWLKNSAKKNALNFELWYLSGPKLNFEGLTPKDDILP